MPKADTGAALRLVNCCGSIASESTVGFRFEVLAKSIEKPELFQEDWILLRFALIAPSRLFPRGSYHEIWRYGKFVLQAFSLNSD
ncbi:hypothetical protein Enr13x_39240 [Stieleria neptunia]|uniref:Uncharacterized protein n=1 Tax=Stieleria neptunia TaxID=2527979 RepID=A0A518HTD1_9BACT|nr:hypothetical protein Enr13x_39240 [Stieleria neptunia]